MHLPEVVADMVRLQHLTGMRPAEVCLIRPMDLDRSDDVWIYRPESHKTEHHDRERVVFIGPLAQGVLLRYLARDVAAYCFRPCDSEAKRRAAQHAARKVPLHEGNRPGSHRKLRPRRSPGNKYDTNAYRRAIHRACDLAFLHPTISMTSESELTNEQLAELRNWQAEHRWSPNQLRHSAAMKIRRRFGLEAAQIALGQGKGRKDRCVMLAARLLLVLREYWKAARPVDYFFPSRGRQGHISRVAVYQACRRAADEAGWPGV